MPNLSDPTAPDRKFSCMEMLQLIIDGDATPEQQQSFKEHMDECMPCFNSYQLDTALKMLLKTKCNGHAAPPALIEKIKLQISQNMPH
jgi:mycothiol system anti-sigma-R factor